MLINVDRIKSDDDATLSIVSLDGAFQCFGLEDGYRAVKVPGETRIPAGRYPITLRDAGGMHPKYQKRFPGLHQGMLWLQDVPGFEWVYIHIGNKPAHTEGCLLVGNGARCDVGKIRVQSSAVAYEALYRKVRDSAASGDLEIEFIENDRMED